MPYYVVNTGRGRSSTHITKLKGIGVLALPFLATPVGVRGAPTTLCGLQVIRHVDVFAPSEASCRECRKRWELDAAAEAAKTPQQHRQEKTVAWVRAVMILAVVIAVTIYIVTYKHH